VREDVEHVAVLVYGAPQILWLPLDPHEQLIQMPGVALAAPAVPQPPCVVEPERSTPLTNRSYVTVTPHSERRSATSRKLRPKRW